MEICVNDYVRTKEGRIEKVKVINKYGIVHKHDSDNDTFDTGINWYAESGREINEEDIKIHSKNIIDLIQEGDIVNGKKIEAIIDGLLKSEGVAERVLCFETDFPIEKGLRCYHNCDIKTILTKEQYEQNSYKI